MVRKQNSPATRGKRSQMRCAGALALFCGIVLTTAAAHAELETLGSASNEHGYVEVAVDTDGGDLYLIWIGVNGENGMVKIGNVATDSTPGVDGGGGTISDDAVDFLADQLKKHGGRLNPQTPFDSTPLGKAWLSKGKGPTPIIDPWEAGAAMNDPFGGYGGGGGGFDPGVPIGEQINKKKGRGSSGDDDDDGNDGGGHARDHGVEAGNPEVIDPPPIKKGFHLFAGPMMQTGAANGAGKGFSSLLAKPGFAGGFHRGPVGIGQTGPAAARPVTALTGGR